jgi:ABC-type microcin C transport system permease subunit YejB
MSKYIVKRLLLVIPTLLAILFIIYLIQEMAMR